MVLQIPYRDGYSRLAYVSGLEEAARLVRLLEIKNAQFLRRAASWMEGNRDFNDPFWKGIVAGYRLIADDLDDFYRNHEEVITAWVMPLRDS